MYKHLVVIVTLGLTAAALPACGASPPTSDEPFTGAPVPGGGTRTNDCPGTVVWDTGMFDNYTPPVGCSSAASCGCFVNAINDGGLPTDGRHLADDWLADGSPITHIKIWGRYNANGYAYHQANPGSLHGFCVTFYEQQVSSLWCPDGTRSGETAIGPIVYEEYVPSGLFVEYEITTGLPRNFNYCITLPSVFEPVAGRVYFVSVSADFDYTSYAGGYTQWFSRVYEGAYDPFCEASYWDTWTGSETPWNSISAAIGQPCWSGWNLAFVLYSNYVPPPTSACCLSTGECYVVGESDCGSMGGAWHSDWLTCDPNPCPVPTQVSIAAGNWIDAEPWHDWVSGYGGEAIPIQAYVPAQLGAVEHVEFFYSLDNGATWDLIADDTDGSEPVLNTVDTSVQMSGCGWFAAFVAPDSLPAGPVQFKSVVHLATGSPVEAVTVHDYDPAPPSIGTTNLVDRIVIDRDGLGTEIFANGAEIVRVIIQRAPMDTAFVKGIPGINQLAYDSMYCAPTAAAQCLKYFEAQGDTAICGGLETSRLVEAMAAYMGTNRGVAGTLPSQWLGGVTQWIGAYGQAYTVRYFRHYFCAGGGSTWTVEDWQRIRNELELCRDVLLGVFWDGGGGHALTLDSISYPENPDRSIRIGCKDPWTGATVTGDLDPVTGHIATLAGAAGGRGAQIGVTMLVSRAESAIGDGVAGDLIYDGQPAVFPFYLEVPIPAPGFWFLHITLVNSRGHAYRMSRVVEYDPDLAGVRDHRDAAPLALSLGMCQPNPTGSGTTVSFTTPDRVRVRLAVYDINGREVRTLLDGEVAPGLHQALWSTTDQDGHAVAAGTYYVKMTAPRYESTRRITVLR